MGGTHPVTDTPLIVAAEHKLFRVRRANIHRAGLQLKLNGLVLPWWVGACS